MVSFKEGMVTILLVEDDDTIAFGIKAFLTKNQFQVLHAETVEKAKALFPKGVDLILLDLNLPDGSGFDYCEYVKRKRDVPLIFLTAREEERDMIKGLDMGGDDYITKPFQLSVLLSRIMAVLRRSSRQLVEEQILVCGNIKMNKRETKVYKDNREIELTAGEYQLLLKLMENKNATLTRAVLLEKLWDANGEFVNNNTLSVAIKRLREKLEDTSHIKTVRGIGYRLEE